MSDAGDVGEWKSKKIQTVSHCQHHSDAKSTSILRYT